LFVFIHPASFFGNGRHVNVFKKDVWERLGFVVWFC